MAKIGNYVVGGEEDGTLRFNEDEQCYEGNPSAEDFEHPFVDEEKERRAGLLDQVYDVPNGNVQVTIEQKIINCQHIIDDMISLNGKKGKSKFGFVNAVGRRNLKRISKLLDEIGELNE